MVLKRVGPVSVAKNAAVLYALMGLLFGAFFSLIALAGGFGAGREAGPFAGFAAIAGVGAIVLFLIFYGCLGFVGGLINAVLYHVIPGMNGGVDADLE